MKTTLSLPRKKRLRLVHVACAGLFIAPAASSAQSTANCRPQDWQANNLMEELKAFMTTTDPERAADRDTLYKVPVVSANQITFVTDNATCSKVAQAYPAGSGTIYPYVIKLGTKGFVSLDPSKLTGEFVNVLVHDKKYKVTGGWTG